LLKRPARLKLVSHGPDSLGGTAMKRQNKSSRPDSRGEIRLRLKNFLMFLPNMVVLLGRLLRDSRVPAAEKALFAAAIIYVVSPLDFIPDIFPFIGQVDDLYVVALTVLRLVNRTDADVVRAHWSGGGDIVAFAESIAAIAPLILPRRVVRVITSRIELSPAGELIRGIGQKRTPLLREIPALDAEPASSTVRIDSTSSLAN